MGFLGLIAQRVLVTIPLLIGISIASFAIIVAVPGDYVDAWMGQTMALTGQSREDLMPRAEALRRELGSDNSVFVRYWIWVKGIVLNWDFGDSFTQSRPVS